MEIGTVQVMPEWRRAHIDFRQCRSSTEVHELSADLLILASSWEKRCVEITKAKHGHYECATVILFAEQGLSGRRAEHDRTLAEFAVRCSSKNLELVRKSSGEVDAWRDSLIQVITQARQAAGRPIDVIIDISCLPKYYALTVLGFCISAGMVRSLKLFYAEGRYAPADANISLAPDHAFTDGEWRSLPVPFLEGRLAPDKKLAIIASIGFETFQARKLIRIYEAERHLLLTPYPGFDENYSERSEAEAMALATNLDLQDGEILRCPAGDAAGVADIVSNLLAKENRFADIGLCLGTKPHAIGFGLAALLRPEFTLVCRLPDRYVEMETPATGMSWVYDVRDLSTTARPQKTARSSLIV